MRTKLRRAFDQVQASQALRESALEYIAAHRESQTRRRTAPRRALAAAVACLILALAGGGGYWMYFTPTAAISVDVNPSLELEVNRFDRVIGVEGFNQEGQALAQQLSVTHLPYEQAVEQVLALEEIAALLEEDEVMTITVTGSNAGQCGRILAQVEQDTAQRPNIHCQSARREEVQAAHELGLSYGRYRAYLELQALGWEQPPETLNGMTMREIRVLIQSLSQPEQSDPGAQAGHHGWGQRPGSGGNGPGAGNGQGNGTGNGQGNGAPMDR